MACICRTTGWRASYGSAAGIDLSGAANVLIEDNKIINNGPAGSGGGLHIDNEADETIVQNLIANNKATSGSQIYSLIPQSTKGFVLINNTIVSAPHGNADAAVIADGFNKNVLFENNIISAAGDKAAILCNPIYNDGPPIVKYNDAYNPAVPYGDSCSGFDGVNGNISANPLFVSTSHFQLTSGSPAIDAGDNSAPDLPTKDLAGNPRIINGNGGPTAIVDHGRVRIRAGLFRPQESLVRLACCGEFHQQDCRTHQRPSTSPRFPFRPATPQRAAEPPSPLSRAAP